jgi:formylglycine-generating enzyme required for sulfatase activity
MFNRSNDATHPATVSDFRLDNYEISVGRFRKFVAAYSQTMTASGAGKNPNNNSDTGWDTAWNANLPADAAALAAAVKCNATYQTWTDSPGTPAAESRPMNCIDWYEAYAFCIWDGGRLPTEAEWNYAACGGSEQRLYPWGATAPGGDANLAVYACYFNGSFGNCTGVTNIAPVGSVSAGNGKWGQSDLAGNVYEMVQDWYVSPYSDPCTNCSYNVSSTGRVIRSGSFADALSTVRSTSRDVFGPTNRDAYDGARCARSP